MWSSVSSYASKWSEQAREAINEHDKSCLRNGKTKNSSRVLLKLKCILKPTFDILQLTNESASCCSNPYALSAPLGTRGNSSMSTDTSPTTVSPTEPTTVEQESCICKEDGLFPTGTCEVAFCQCAHGVGNLMRCGEGTFFHPEHLVCAWASQYPGCTTSQHISLN